MRPNNCIVMFNAEIQCLLCFIFNKLSFMALCTTVSLSPRPRSCTNVRLSSYFGLH